MRIATTTSRSWMSATSARRPPHGHGRTSSKYTRRRSDAQSIRAPTGRRTPAPRLVRGCSGAALSLVRPRSVLSGSETSDAAASEFAFTFLGLGFAVGAHVRGSALFGTTAARQDERGASTPDRRKSGSV